MAPINRNSVDASPMRTAVLVIHGIGTQRAMETVRGVAAAVLKPDTRLWLHPEPSGVDVDLSVLTATQIGTVEGPRCVDFHEFYWAHLMSETRAVAVLLWLFELVRKGPLLRKGMNAVWWGTAAFLATGIASVTLILLHLIQRFSEVVDEVTALVLAPIFVICTATTYSALSSTFERAWKIAAWSIALSILLIVFLDFGLNWSEFGHYTDMFLPAVLSGLIVLIAMGRRGLLVCFVVYLTMNISLMVVQNARWQIWWDRSNVVADIWKHHWIPFFTPEWQPFAHIWSEGWIAWSMTEHWSTTIACWVLILYFALNFAFLQFFLGDVARYFRNHPSNVAVRREIRKEAVATLASLHEAGSYDRIIVVAHSLGSVIGYDMLRSYFGRICDSLPSPHELGPVVEQLDNFEFNENLALQDERARFRDLSRSLVAAIAKYPAAIDSAGGTKSVSKWLVTDFVTLGSPLTHAQYLMCAGNSRDELAGDFERRIQEREFPTCPPSGKHRLLFERDSGNVGFHHGAMFAFTRWTNLFFPLKQLFWGDAIGGPIARLFGPFISDQPVTASQVGKDGFFSHTSYWRTSGGNRLAPSILELERAVDLTDSREEVGRSQS
jgi:hypothetical protein